MPLDDHGALDGIDEPRRGSQPKGSSVLWRDSLGRPVDITDIDKEYALNILIMTLLRRGRDGCTGDSVKTDELVQALRETILHGREPNEEDKARAALYNKLNRKEGLRFRAPVDDQADEYAPPDEEAWQGHWDILFTRVLGRDSSYD